MKKKGILIILFAALLGITLPVHAQDSSLFFTVSPARQQVLANPGEEFSLAVTFFNLRQTPVSGMVKAADFIVEDDKGTPTIIEDAQHASPKYSASAWFTLLSDRITINPNDKVVVQARVKIPTEAKPGGRYTAIYFEPLIGQKLEEEAGANTTPRIASLIYIRVAGPISEHALISDMFAKGFYEYGPIDVTAKITNKGDYHIRPKGTFTLYDSFGEKADQKKLKEANIFPDAQYTFATTFGQKWMMGKYKITLNAQYGAEKQSIERSLFVWVFPWRVVTISLLSIIIIGIVGRYAYSNFLRKEEALEDKLQKDEDEIAKLKERLGDKT